MKLLALAVLIVGLAAGAVIYVFADEPQAQTYVVIGDTAYPVDQASSHHRSMHIVQVSPAEKAKSQ